MSNQIKMSEVIIAVGPTRPFLQRFACFLLCGNAGFADFCGGRASCNIHATMCPFLQPCLGNMPGKPGRPLELQPVRVRGYRSWWKISGTWRFLVLQLINHCACFPILTRLYLCLSQLAPSLNVNTERSDADREDGDDVPIDGYVALPCDFVGADGAACGYVARSTTALSTHKQIGLTTFVLLRVNRWCAINALGVVESLLRWKLPKGMRMLESKKGVALDQGEGELDFWKFCTHQRITNVQFAHMKLRAWIPCRHMWSVTSRMANMFCICTYHRLNSCFWGFLSFAMDTWFGAAPPGNERQVRPRTGRNAKDHEQLLTAVARSTLKNTQTCRNLESSVFVTYILAKDSTYAQTATAAGQTYAQRTRAASKRSSAVLPFVQSV